MWRLELATSSFHEEDGSVPLIRWLDDLPVKAQDKCLARLTRPEMLGHELRRPEADSLREGIYELRVSLQSQQYRMLYFFHGKVAAVVSHGLIKGQQVPPKEIDRAVARKKRFLANPKRYSFTPEHQTLTSPALRFTYDRYIKGKPEREASYEAEVANAEVARKLYDLRTKAGLSQRELAKRIGTTASVICRLEDADMKAIRWRC